MTIEPHPDEPLHAVRSLRREHCGVLAFGDRRAPVRFVHDPARLEVVIPVEPAVLGFESVVLFCPDEPVCHVQIMLAPRAIDRPEASAIVDKWSAYHGAGSAKRWAACEVEGIRTASAVVDPDALRTPGLPPGVEARLVKRVNLQRDQLGAACLRLAAADVADPLCVGVDDAGFDVRARFGIVRLEFPALVAAEDDAARAIDALLAPGAAP